MSTTEEEPSRVRRAGPHARAASFAALTVFAFIVLRHAWMMDDTYITLRVIDNWFAGHGLVWNRGERVWVYTHPLWMMTIAAVHAITREYFYTLLFMGAALSTAALAIVALRLARAPLLGASLVVCATLSHAFVDYSTSGLENPLSHLLFALSAWVYLGRLPSARRFALLCLLGGLSLLCRPDNALVLGPLVLAAGVQAWRRGARVRELLLAALIAGIPLWAWELFALVYYGVAIPNTALAKLNHGIESHELIAQGFFYVLATLNHDPLTLAIIAAGALAPIVTRDWRLLPFVVGIGLSLVYMISIGGDFMLGRLLCAPMFLALVCLSQVRVGLPSLAAATGLGLALGLMIEPNTLEINRTNTRGESEARTHWRITDERPLLYKGAGLVNASRTVAMPSHRWTRLGMRGERDGKHSKVGRALGFMGQASDPELHWIDDVALTDPFLSRLPALYTSQWMHGHFLRTMPEGYRETVETGENQLEDPDLAELYDRLALVTQAPLWSRERFAAIWWLNTGGPEALVDVEAWQFHDALALEPEELEREAPEDGTALSARGVHRFNNRGVLVEYAERQWAAGVELSVNDNDRFELWLYDDAERIAEVEVPRKLKWDEDGLMTRHIELPAIAQERGFTRLRVVPVTKARAKAPLFGIGHLVFD